MKPMRNLANAWIGNLPKERKGALASLAVLLIMLGALVVYQRLFVPLTESPAEINGGTNQASATGASTPPVSSSDSPPGKVEPVEAVAEAPTKLARPLPGDHKVLAGFSFGYSETYQDYRMNTGITFQAKPGEEVRAAAAGTVMSIEMRHPADGVVVTLDHGGGLSTRYAGLQKVLVQLNSKVEVGSPVGQVGAPGPARSRLGPHLHFETRMNDEPVDPAQYLTQEN